MDFLIEELRPSEAKIVVESDATVGKELWLSGIFMQSSARNRNGRIYPMTEMQREIDAANAIINETNGIFGELDHPTTLTINLDRVSHVITELKMVGTDVYGRAKIVQDTPVGQIAKALINTGVRIGVSSRAAGSVNESTGEVSNFAFVTVDIVAQPSAHKALPVGVYESIQRTSNGKVITSLAEAVVHDDSAQKYFQKEILKFVAEMGYAKRK